MSEGLSDVDMNCFTKPVIGGNTASDCAAEKLASHITIASVPASRCRDSGGPGWPCAKSWLRMSGQAMYPISNVQFRGVRQRDEKGAFR